MIIIIMITKPQHACNAYTPPPASKANILTLLLRFRLLPSYSPFAIVFAFCYRIHRRRALAVSRPFRARLAPEPRFVAKERPNRCAPVARQRRDMLPYRGPAVPRPSRNTGRPLRGQSGWRSTPGCGGSKPKNLTSCFRDL